MNVVIAVFLVLLFIAAALAQDFPVFSWAFWQEDGDTTASRSEVVRNLGLLAAGVIGLGFGIWRAVTAHRQTQAAQGQTAAANEQARIAQQHNITDRFSTAVEHLGSEQLPVRLGGIYALWRLIKDSQERDVTSVIDILCAFVRHPPHEPVGSLEPDASSDGGARGDEEAPTNNVRPDVQTVLSLIGNEKDDYRALLPDRYCLDLARATLWGANLTGASLNHSNLTDAILWDTNLTRTNLYDTNFTNAILEDTILTNANLEDTNLTGADLSGADLSAAQNLTQEQLDVIRYDPDNPPKLPPGLTLPEPPPEPPAESAAPSPPEV